MRRLAIAATLISTALLPAAARASAYTDVLHVYQASGSIPACSFSSAQLSAAMKGIDTYGQQYFADFTGAIQAALAARASGSCAPGAHSFTAAGGVRGAALPASLTSPTDADLPLPIVLMGALGIVLVTTAGIGALARGSGWEPAWVAGWRHAWAEAAYRLKGGWAEVIDWWRSGR